MNNFQRIRQMNIDELSEFIFVNQVDGCSHCAYYGDICNGKFFDTKSCLKGIKAFLSSENDSAIRLQQFKLNVVSNELTRNPADFRRRKNKGE